VTFKELKNFRAAAFAALLLIAAATHAQTASVEIQGVSAADAGKKNQTFAPSIAHLKGVLKETVFGTFTDAGKQDITVTAGAKASSRVKQYELDVTLKDAKPGKCRLELTIKDGGKPIGDPICVPVTKGQPKMVAQVGNREQPLILIFTLKD